MPAPAEPSPRKPRPSYLAAPPLLTEHEPFEGAALIRELPGALGLVLWKTLRDVSAWTDAMEPDRCGLFPPGAAEAREEEIAAAGAEGELWAPLLVVARLVGSPTRVDHPRLVHACRAVARWGERRGRTAVQLAFTQAAARLAPEHPRLAYAVGRLARDRGELARAESWLRASIRLARQRDWHTYAMAYLSLGTLYQQLGNLPAARSLTLRGYRTAHRRRVGRLRGMALHNLFTIAAEMLDFDRAHRYALAAATAYGPGHELLPALAHDLGCFWLLHGCFARAAETFEQVLPRISHPDERLLALGNLARASAAAGRLDAYRRGRSEAIPLLGAAEVTPARAAQVWLDLARGAATVGDHTAADEAAERSLEIGRPLRLGQLRLEAEALRESIAAARAAGRPVPHPGPAEAMPETHTVAALVRALAPSAA